MADTDTQTDPLDDLTEEFARRWREGERPSVEEYAKRYPQWADDIRTLFPAVLLMEQLKPRRDDRATAPAPPTAGGPLPERLGDYRIVREIGRGGMGVVYEARHETLHRRVAIKVLPAHLFADEKLRVRFRRESQAAARLHHTNIVPVFDVGEQDGLYYYVMQLIAGRSLDEPLPVVARSPDLATAPDRRSPGSRSTGDLRSDSGARSGDRATTGIPSSPLPLLPSSELSPRHIAHLGVQVADALAYAHTQGVLHRDVKPSNLLLDGQGTVWVTDFGVAKLVEEANLTASGDFVGTLRYMPPERFGGQSDERGDVYSLGITLYELLGRRPAFPETTPQHLIQLITHADRAPLRKLDSTIPTDLETIVLKAAAREPGDRYQTAAELSDDLRRFLDDRPVKARRTSAAEQVWRWCRRNRLVAGLSAAAVGLLVLTTVVSVAAYVRTSNAKHDTEIANSGLKNALTEAQDQRERAENTSSAALEAMNHIYDRFAPNRIVAAPSLPADGSTEEGIDIPAQPTLPPEAVPLLGELLEFYEQLAREGGDNPRRRHQAAEAEQRIGDIRQRLGQLEPAITAYQKAADLYAQVPAEQRGDTGPIKVARTYNELGRALRGLQRTDEAREAHGKALTVLADAPRECAIRPECRYELARTYYFQSQREPGGEPAPDRGPGRGPDGRGPPDRGRGPDGGRGPGRGPDDFGRGRGPGPRGEGPPPSDADRQASRKAIEILEVLKNEHPTVPEYRHLLACCYRDAPPNGPRSMDAATDPGVLILRQLVKDFHRVPDYRYDLAETLARRSGPGGLSTTELGVAQRQLEEAATIAKDLTDEYPKVPLYAASRALIYDRLGDIQEHLGQPGEALLPYQKAISLQTVLVRQHADVLAYDLTLARMQRSLARVQADRKELKEARTLLEGTADHLEALLKKVPTASSVRFSLGRTQRDLADVLTRLGEKDLAAKARKRADELGPERRGGPPGPPPN